MLFFKRINNLIFLMILGKYTKSCPNDDEFIGWGKFCRICGSKRTKKTPRRYCPNCYNIIYHSEAAFCDDCGYVLKKEK